MNEYRFALLSLCEKWKLALPPFWEIFKYLRGRERGKREREGEGGGERERKRPRDPNQAKKIHIHFWGNKGDI